jgi:hypothetical protein
LWEIPASFQCPIPRYLLPELVGVKAYQADEFKEKVEWMMARGFLREAPNYTEVVRSK